MVNKNYALHLEKLDVISVCKNMQQYAEMLIYKIFLYKKIQ